jgi:transcriptional regulator EpsA
MFDAVGQRHAEYVVRTIEGAAAVQRRSQFYVWLGSGLDALLPHQVAVCGSWQRSRRDVVFDTFDRVALSAPVLAAFGRDDTTETAGLPPLPVLASPLLLELQRQWVQLGGRCVEIDVETLRSGVPLEATSALLKAGLEQLLVHGVARPQRPNEIESLFVFGSVSRPWQTRERVLLELLVPVLHATWTRVQVNERALAAPGTAASAAPKAAAVPRGSAITERERQILRCMREGKRNQEIGVLLEISALTVKNHVQKILRKLSAANRAQAVAVAMSRNLM